MNISVLITTLNAAEELSACLTSLTGFDDVIVIDSKSQDSTQDIAHHFDARVVNYEWNGAYPKKRQWCLDHLEIKNDYIFFVDADEVLTLDLIAEIKSLDLSAAGYFVRGNYLWQDKILNHGLKNNKLVLFDRHKIEFPVVNDLDIEGMGEMEGHYQPILKDRYKNETVGQVTSCLHHNAYDNPAQWEARHKRYAAWEAQMIKRDAYPKDPSSLREILKNTFRKLPARGFIAFCHSYILKLGFLDGVAGYQFARSRWHYYQMVSNALKTNKSAALFCEIHKAHSASQK